MYIYICIYCFRVERVGVGPCPAGTRVRGSAARGHTARTGFAVSISGNNISGISDSIFEENYYTFALERDRKFHVCSNLR